MHRRLLPLALLALLLLVPSAGHGQGGLTITVDVAADRRPISPDIYGMNFPDDGLRSELGLTVQRWGGNATTRYNYLNDVSNRGSDYFFQNVPDGDGQGLPDNSGANRFISDGRADGTSTILTVPLIGYTPQRRPPNDSHPYDCGFSVARYGPQQAVDPWDPDCGNGRRANGSFVVGNDPADTSSAIDEDFVRGWVTHLVGRHGAASAGGVRFYNLDNEPGLWHETHRDVHPAPATYAELRDRGISYAAAIKAIDPGALTLGPVQDGWTRYIFAAYVDWAQADGDRQANGGVDFVPWYLQQLRQHEQANGTRLLDYLDLHYYPQADGVALQPAGEAGTQALRLRSTRSLWDPTYNDESWISTTEPGGVTVNLIPRMRGWVEVNYPGTKLAITEYNWGGLESLNGALAQAEVLGIFGREGVDLATIWAPPAPDAPGAFAFRIYRNYDGAGGRFGTTSVRATSSAAVDDLSVYAAQRGDGALTIVVINKSGGALNGAIGLSNFSPGAAAQVYRYSGANLGAIVRLADLSAAGGLSASFPASSITLLVVPPAVALEPGLWLPLVGRN